MGFVVILVMFVYFAISLVVVAWAIKHAKKNGLSVKKWGWGAALVMYLIPFWDWLPTVAVHQYYCAKESGFWVYKTLDQWKVENPGVMETLTKHENPAHEFKGGSNNLISTTFWNSRIKSIHTFNGPIFLHAWRREDVLVDIKTGEVLARYVDYSTSQQRRQAGWGGWKIWLANDDCIGGRNMAIRYVGLVNQFKGAEK